MKFFIAVFLFFISINLHAVCKNKSFTFNIKNTKQQAVTILDILENLSEECKITILFEDDQVETAVNKKINYINVQDFLLEEIFDLILSEQNIFHTFSKNGKILKLSYLKTESFFIDYVSFTQRKSSTSKVIKTGSKSGEGEDSTTVDFTSEFKFWDKIEIEINAVLTREGDSYNTNSKALINQDAGLITVSGTKKQLDRVEKYIKTITKRLHKQILIDAKIIELTYDNAHTNGIDWSKFELTINGNSDAIRSSINDVFTNNFDKPNYLLGYNFSIEGLLKFLKTHGKVNIVSNPKILTLNNQPAVINVGEEKNYRYSKGSTTTVTNGTTVTTPDYEVDSIFVGVTLDIAPEVTQDDHIILKINPIISEISEEHLDKDGIPYLAPDIKVKQLSSIVKVKNGNKILIGGLIQKSSEDKITKIPLLGDLPIIEHAFKSKRTVTKNSELFIIITPKIVKGNEQSSLLEKIENTTNIKEEI